MTDQHEKVLREFAIRLRHNQASFEHYDALTALLDERERMERIPISSVVSVRLEDAYMALMSCIHRLENMEGVDADDVQAVADDLDDLRRELKGESDGTSK